MRNDYINIERIIFTHVFYMNIVITRTSRLKLTLKKSLKDPRKIQKFKILPWL